MFWGISEWKEKCRIGCPERKFSPPRSTVDEAGIVPGLNVMFIMGEEAENKDSGTFELETLKLGETDPEIPHRSLGGCDGGLEEWTVGFRGA
jgi:hypothetical protein